MSLQGSLDTFALPDVLVLLASTKKTGELHVAGQRGTTGPAAVDIQGLLWFDNGMLVGHAVARAVHAAGAVFELLRLAEGSFSFEAGAPQTPDEPLDIEVVLGEAQGYLAEWQEIEKVVPSLASWLRLAPEAPGAHVSMRAEQWGVIVAVASGCDVATLVDKLGRGELAGCRAIKELNESGLVELVDAPAGPSAFAGGVEREYQSFPRDGVSGAPEAPTPPANYFNDELSTKPFDSAVELSDIAVEAFAVEPFAVEAFAVEAFAVEAFAVEPEPDPDPLDAITDFDSLVTLPSRARRKTEARSPAPRTRGSVDKDDADADAEPAPAAGLGLAEAQALARQLASINDDAAVSTAVEGTDVAEATAEPGGAAADDEPLNRGLLLKFLSSVRN